ncbi:hypothetical protein [Streptomyces goshikiensis]|uniref:hypothetical protein n=1 Tax=Streptomyces goshikiensis TaxID=1942 RepID=UPI0036A0C9F9
MSRTAAAATLCALLCAATVTTASAAGTGDGIKISAAAPGSINWDTAPVVSTHSINWD